MTVRSPTSRTCGTVAGGGKVVHSHPNGFSGPGKRIIDRLGHILLNEHEKFFDNY
jgi:hypothetical protein